MHTDENLKATIPSTDYDRRQQLQNVGYINNLGSLITNESWLNTGN